MAWVAITSVGVLGIFLVRNRFVAAGLVLVAIYAALGFDGLGHYSVAPMELHTFTANLTILSEAGAAAILLPVTVYLLALQLRHRGWRDGGA